jgi:hypothetical protein
MPKKTFKYVKFPVEFSSFPRECCSMCHTVHYSTQKCVQFCRHAPSEKWTHNGPCGDKFCEKCRRCVITEKHNCPHAICDNCGDIGHSKAFCQKKKCKICLKMTDHCWISCPSLSEIKCTICGNANCHKDFHCPQCRINVPDSYQLYDDDLENDKRLENMISYHLEKDCQTVALMYAVNYPSSCCFLCRDNGKTAIQYTSHNEEMCSIYCHKCGGSKIFGWFSIICENCDTFTNM